MLDSWQTKEGHGFISIYHDDDDDGEKKSNKQNILYGLSSNKHPINLPIEFVSNKFQFFALLPNIQTLKAGFRVGLSKCFNVFFFVSSP